MRSWRTKIVLVPLRLGGKYHTERFVPSMFDNLLNLTFLSDNHYDHERKCHFVQGPCRCRLNV